MANKRKISDLSEENFDDYISEGSPAEIFQLRFWLCKGLPFTMIIKNWFGSIPQWKIKLVFVVFIIMNLLDHISLILKFDIKFRALSLKSFHIIKSNH